MKEAVAADLIALVAKVRRDIASPGLLYLVARTSHLAEGWCEFAPRLILAGDGNAEVEHAARSAGVSLGVEVVWESPADVIPLPGRWQQRARPAPASIRFREGLLDVRHFDPYSVALRLIARGDEPDYIDALEFVTRGWVDFAHLEELVTEVLPSYTSETLAQDPAEFRRKFRGLRQLYRGGPAELRYATKIAEVAWV